jgi:hypothetical protein
MMNPEPSVRNKSQVDQNFSERFPVRIGKINIGCKIDLARVVRQSTAANKHRSRLAAFPQFFGNTRQHQKLPFQRRCGLRNPLHYCLGLL